MITEIKGFEKYITDNPFRSVQFGDQRMYKFENNHGASVIFHRGSHGFDQGLLELMIVDWLPDGSQWLFNTEPFGYLTPDCCATVLAFIREGYSYNEIKALVELTEEEK
ncbi:hypothetical protein [Leuconostoc fallax]|uniref:hypothetical protein n=1 Tax=Leuconostoc fallax TaxID=1251 RepID=UPI001C1EFEB5|nr:hypothetical protein [Leuconostoc fallax]MBU7455697.1 hypothetical protein [Leuconostoc fallax]